MSLVNHDVSGINKPIFFSRPKQDVSENVRLQSSIGSAQPLQC